MPKNMDPAAGLAHVLRATTKKGHQVFFQKKSAPSQLLYSLSPM